MTDEEMLTRTRETGWRLGTRALDGATVWTWRDTRRPDETQPCFTSREHALGWLLDRLRHEGIFE